jgi:hypothetical protein
VNHGTAHYEIQITRFRLRAICGKQSQVDDRPTHYAE